MTSYSISYPKTPNKSIYDGEGRRVQQSVSGTVTQYLNDTQPGLWKLLQATTGANTTRYVHGPMGLDRQVNPDGSLRTMVVDGLGNVRGVVDNSVAVQESQQYDPYGQPYGNTGSPQSTFGFTGEPTDGNGLVQLRARYYNPTVGQFVSIDPMETPNRFQYAGANPANMVDPLGLCADALKQYPAACTLDDVLNDNPTVENWLKKLGDDGELSASDTVPELTASLLSVLGPTVLVGGLAATGGLLALSLLAIIGLSFFELQSPEYLKRLKRNTPYDLGNPDPNPPDKSQCNCEERTQWTNLGSEAKFGKQMLSPVQDMLCDLMCNNGDVYVASYARSLAKGAAPEVLDEYAGFYLGLFAYPGLNVSDVMDPDIKAHGVIQQPGGLIFVRQAGPNRTRADVLATFIEEIQHSLQYNNLAGKRCSDYTVYNAEYTAKYMALLWAQNYAMLPSGVFHNWAAISNPDQAVREQYGDILNNRRFPRGVCPEEKGQVAASIPCLPPPLV